MPPTAGALAMTRLLEYNLPLVLLEAGNTVYAYPVGNSQTTQVATQEGAAAGKS